MKIGKKSKSVSKLSGNKTKKLERPDAADRVVEGGRKSYVEKLAGDKPAWMQTTAADQQGLRDRKNAEQQANRRAPEFFLFDGDSKSIRIVGLIATLERYSYPMAGGKWGSATAPALGEVDLFRTQLGLRAAERYVYEVIDIDGYIDKNSGKQHSNLRRFWVVPRKMHEQLEKIRSKRGDLDLYDIEVSRMGKGTSTTYQLLPDPASRFKKTWRSQDELGTDGVIEHYSPPDEQTQRNLLGMIETESD